MVWRQKWKIFHPSWSGRIAKGKSTGIFFFARRSTSSRYDSEGRNVINAGAHTRDALGAPCAWGCRRGWRQSPPLPRAFAAATSSAAAALRPYPNLCTYELHTLADRNANIVMSVRFASNVCEYVRIGYRVGINRHRRARLRWQKPRRLPPRVLASTFFYSDHRPRATRRAVRTSSYIIESVLPPVVRACIRGEGLRGLKEGEKEFCLDKSLKYFRSNFRARSSLFVSLLTRVFFFSSILFLSPSWFSRSRLFYSCSLCLWRCVVWHPKILSIAENGPRKGPQALTRGNSTAP